MNTAFFQDGAFIHLARGQRIRVVDIDGSTINRAELRARVREREHRERLLEIIQNREIWTAEFKEELRELMREAIRLEKEFISDCLPVNAVGLAIDEYPVIAKGFDAPLEEGMLLAVEPKIGLPGLGMVGVENTFEVTARGGRCLTGADYDIICVER